MGKQKGLAPVLVVLLVVIPVILAVSGYLIYQQFKPSFPSEVVTNPEPSPDKTASWKTYRSEKMNFSFRYPSSQEDFLEEYEWGIKMGCACVDFDWFDVEFIPSKSAPENWWINSGKKTFNGGVGLNDKFHPEAWEVSTSSASLDGKVGLLVNAKTRINPPSKNPAVTRGGEPFQLYILQLNDGLIVITKYATESKQNEEFNQILSTFKFLDQNETSKASPDGSYAVTEQTVGDRQIITVKDKQGNIIVDDLVAKNSAEIGYNVKFKCQCGTSFKQWVNDSTFSIKIVNGGGEEFEYKVDARSGKVDESSFKRIK